MRDALYAADRPVLFSLCEWGDNKPWTWAENVGHMWRTTGDIYHCWDCEWNHGIWSSWGILKIVDMQKDLRKYAGPDHWNDPDMMEVGNGMSISEDRAHFSMWCMLAAPLIAGNDLMNMKKETIDILTNKEVIAIDQDSLGVQGYKMLDFGDLEVWVKPLKNLELAVCFLNRALPPKPVEFNWKDFPINDGLSNFYIDFNNSTYNIRDLWAKRMIGTTDKTLNLMVPGHDVVLLKLIK